MLKTISMQNLDTLLATTFSYSTLLKWENYQCGKVILGILKCVFHSLGFQEIGNCKQVIVVGTLRPRLPLWVAVPE